MTLKPLKTHKTFEGLTQFWEHDSTSTKTKMKFSTFIPEGKPKGCIIWLSGLTCTDENFITKAGAQKYLAEHQLMVLCPDTSPRGLQLPQEHDSYDFGSGAGFYVNATTAGYKDHYRMYSYVAEELFSMITTEFSIAKDKVSIMGHSMGGHGALILGLKEATKFQSISAFSPIVNPMAGAWGKKAFMGYFGEAPEVWAKHDATELVKAGVKHAHPILIDQGTQDEFLQKGELLTDHFEKACAKTGQALTTNYRDQYDHSYYFISTFIESHVQHHAQYLK